MELEALNMLQGSSERQAASIDGDYAPLLMQSEGERDVRQSQPESIILRDGATTKVSTYGDRNNLINI